MAYTSISTTYSVGDIVYRHNQPLDCVERGKVITITATTSGGGYAPGFDITYHVEFGGGPEDASQDELHERPMAAFQEADRKAEELKAAQAEAAAAATSPDTTA